MFHVKQFIKKVLFLSEMIVSRETIDRIFVKRSVSRETI